MADYIEVNMTALEQDTGELRGTLKLVRDDMDAMFDTVQELDAMWDGPANNEFNRQFANDNENAKGLCQTVESLINCMEYAKEQYNSCENQVNGIVSAINI